MAEEPRLKMSDVSCKRLAYSITIALDKFNLDLFKAAFRSTRGLGGEAGGATLCNTLDSAIADYHVHMNWRLHRKREEIELEVEYVQGAQQPAPDETEPYAENVMPWLAQFFIFPDANAKRFADFAFPEGKRQPFFVLPLKTRIPELDADAEIDGISVGLPTRPGGIERVFVSQLKDSLYLGIQSQTTVEFAQFSIQTELMTARNLTGKLVR